MNKLNIIKMIPICPCRTPSNWLRNFKYIVRSFKMAYQRITKGYCYWDWYDLDCYYSAIIADSLRDLAEKSCSHPWDVEPEAWTKKLENLANQFDLIGTDTDDYNPYYEEWADKGTNWEAYNRETILLHEKRNKLIHDSFEELAEIYNDLWD